MISGIFNADREATISLKIVGMDGTERDITAMIDTGFNGYLTLPLAVIEELGFPYVISGSVTVGDGRIEDLDIYAATIVWDGHLNTVETDAAETFPLIGMSLLYGYDLHIHALDGGEVTIKKIF